MRCHRAWTWWLASSSLRDSLQRRSVNWVTPVTVPQRKFAAWFPTYSTCEGCLLDHTYTPRILRNRLFERIPSFLSSLGKEYSCRLFKKSYEDSTSENSKPQVLLCVASKITDMNLSVDRTGLSHVRHGIRTSDAEVDQRLWLWLHPTRSARQGRTQNTKR